jgi:molybdopterin synthase catalytic subunit
MIRIVIQQEAFEVGAEIAALERASVGAIASFIGLVRADNGVSAIELEHYPGMTDSSLTALGEEAQRRWSLMGCTIIHRVGTMAVGEPIVLVVTASAHRAEALDACAFLIDRLKTDAPFWKKEYRGQTASWVEAKGSDDARADRWS